VWQARAVQGSKLVFRPRKNCSLPIERAPAGGSRPGTVSGSTEGGAALGDDWAAVRAAPCVSSSLSSTVQRGQEPATSNRLLTGWLDPAQAPTRNGPRSATGA